MGFDHAKTAHHFRLFTDGGAIEVSANGPADPESRDQIHGHLAHVAAMFSAGNFELPMFIHDQLPPGAAVMKEKRAAIRYRYADTPAGGRVRIETRDAAARRAVHDFLRFQIEDLRTGDSRSVVAAPREPGGGTRTER